MQKRLLGKTGLEVSVLGLGTAEIGFNPVTDEQVSRLLNSALDSGVNLIDTASAYLASESLIGKFLSSRRNDFYLVTKCGAIEGFSKSDWSKDGIVKTAQQSLKNLKTDYLDILLLHSCGQLEMQWGEALAGIEEAKKLGLARFIGYSGDGPAAHWAACSGRFDVIETSVNIADQQSINLVLPYAKKNNLGVIVKRPIANAAWRYKTQPDNEYHQEYWKRLAKLEYEFLNHSDPAEIALRFSAFQTAVSCLIVGTLNPERFQTNMQTIKKGPLPDDTIAYIQNRWSEVADQSWYGQI